MSELSNESLLEGAECAKLSAEEADRLFFQINSSIPDQNLRGIRKTEAVEAAIAMCRSCPVLKQCLEYALRHPESAEYGVWGGTTVAQRRRILRLGENAINKAIESAGK
ncbi:MAG: WhiB family transcriptional regulator [Candidatus Nanosynbacter sp.]|nr:WhiB family transcriptional regulator [Candidatus Nanosynbacter sp.]